MNFIKHFIATIGLTILTQIGGVIYLITLLLTLRLKQKRRLKRVALFTFLYLILTFILVPILAPAFGREKISTTDHLTSHSFFYILSNRNYVTPELHTILKKLSTQLEDKYPDLKLIYLDANFPFIDGFPLLPHLSHNDGKKVDVSFIYSDKLNGICNDKPSVSGYGIYEAPKPHEQDQICECKKKGYWQYDFSRYLTFGTTSKDLEFSHPATKELIQLIIKEAGVGKLFIEPHLKGRLGLSNSKIRYHGCQAVRHDDHIHFQLH